MSNKIKIDLSELEAYQKRLEELAGGAAVKRGFESALKAAQNVIARNVDAAMMKHVGTGETKGSIIDNAAVEWTGDVASVDVGFRISKGGLPSIFLMYGTKLHGQPHITPDRNLYKAVYGAKVRKQILQIQKEAFEKVIERVMR